MATQRDLLMTTELPPEKMFDALLQHVQDGRYELRGLSNETRQLAFGKGAGLKNIDGRVFVAQVEGTESGSQLQLALDNTGPNGLLSGWLNGRAGAKMMSELADALDSETPPSPEPVDSFAELDDGSSVPWTSGTLEELVNAHQQ